VVLPATSETSYSLYFSRGVVLEAEVLARHLLNQKTPPRHLVQIYRDDDVGRAASQALIHALSGSNIAIESRVLLTDMVETDALQLALSGVKNKDAVMFWMRPNEVTALGNIKPVLGTLNYFSAELGQVERAPFPTEWKSYAHFVYPYELPEKRETNLAYFRAWLNIRKLPLVDEAMQSEAFFALNFLTDTLSEMLNNLYRDYLIERAESMINKREGGKAEQENRDRVALGRAGDLVRKHGEMTVEAGQRIQISGQTNSASKSQGTTIYPHLSLGRGQRFASKGGYIVRFADGNSGKLVAESDWIVP
jgi:hypothetical protein